MVKKQYARMGCDEQRATGFLLPMGCVGRLGVADGTPAPDRKQLHRVDMRASFTQLRASYIDDEGRRASHWRSPSQTEKACFPQAAHSAYPFRGNRESGRRDSS
jgi:hypothetical protein